MGCSQSRKENNNIYTQIVKSISPLPDETPVFRSINAPELVSRFRDSPEIDNLQAAYLKFFKAYAKEPMHGTRLRNADGTFGDYVWKTYDQVKQICLKVGSGILSLDLAPPVKGEKEGEEYRFIAIYAKNREEWVQTDIAGCLYGLTAIALYDTLGHEAMVHVFDQTLLSTVFCSGENIDKLLKGAESGEYKTLRNIVSFDQIKEEQINRAKAKNIRIIQWAELIAEGEKKIHDLPKVTGDTIYTFMYTSGTTALPKAVMITHSNLIAGIAGYSEAPITEVQGLGPGDYHLSYLPLAHSFERMFSQFLYYKGVAIGFISGDVTRLTQDLAALRPTVFICVPRILNRFHDSIKANLEKLEPGFKKDLVNKAIATKIENLKTEGTYTHALYDRIVFGKMREIIGGRVKFILSGGAPLASDIGAFLKIAFSTPIVEGYGLTETCACGLAQNTIDTNSGRVGGPAPCIEVKLIDVPEMNYTTKDKAEDGTPIPRGELCIRGPTVFKGYYKNPKETAEVFDQDGWFHTGDIARINPDGSFSIIDRKKNIYKLAQGEYIAPEKIENVYNSSKYVSEAFVYGDSLQTFLVGILVPDKEALERLAQQLDIPGTFEELCNNDQIKEAILADLVRAGKEAGFQGFEHVKKIYLEPKSFILSGLCTPSLKLKRAPAKQHYQDIIKKLYA